MKTWTPLFLVAAAACSSSSSSNAPAVDSGTAIDGPTACADLASAYCTKINSCAPLSLEIAFGDVATCTARGTATCKASLAAKGTSATPASHEACAKAIASESCDDAFTGKQPAACATAPGTLAADAACGEDAQCQSAFCTKVGGAYCGKCATAPAAGADCSNGRCGAGLVCAANAKCVAPGALDATCDANTPCLATLSCHGGKCVTPVADGAACDPQQMTTAGCSPTSGDYCNALTKVCTKVTIATTNQQCGLARGGLTGCSAAGHCRVPMNMATGVCVAAAADGAACDDANGPSCMAGSRCTNAICKPDDPTSCN